MPTPPLNSELTISHLTAGTRQPYSIESEVILRISASGRSPFSGVKPTSCMSRKATTNMTSRTPARTRNGHAEAGRLGDQAAGDRAGQHRDPGDDLAPAEDRLEVAVEAGRRERVDQPRLDRPGEEGEAEPEQHRGHRPLPEGRLDLPQGDVEHGRDGQRHRAEQVGDPAADGVGDDPGRDLEEHHPGGEEGVGRERLGVREPGVEQEDRVDPPDERRRQRVAQHQDQVRPHDRTRRRHPPTNVRGGVARLSRRAARRA